MPVPPAPSALQPWPLRLGPGDDLRGAIEAALRAQGGQAAFVLGGIGSLSTTRLRLAGAERPIKVAGDVEILSLAGSIGVDGAHLHASVPMRRAGSPADMSRRAAPCAPRPSCCWRCCRAGDSAAKPIPTRATPSSCRGRSPRIDGPSPPIPGLTRRGGVATMNPSRPDPRGPMNTPSPRPTGPALNAAADSPEMRAWLRLREELAELHGRLEYAKLMIVMGVGRR